MITKGRKGMVLGLVIIIMAVLSILGVSLLSLSVASAKSTAYQDKSKQAYYLARSGADAVSTHLVNNPNEDTTVIAKTSEDTPFENGIIKVDVNGGGNEVRIIGTGKYSGVEKTATAVIAKLTVGEMINKAIYTNSDLDITGMSVVGDIQSGGNINYKTNGSHTFKGNSLAKSPLTINIVLPPDIGSYTKIDVLEVTGNTSVLEKNHYIEKLTIENNATLTIKAENKVVNIVVDTLGSKGNINIKTDTGNKGRVNLFVIKNMEVTTKGNINNDDPNKLYIYMQKNSVFKMQANITVFAYILAPEAAAVIQSNQSTIYGSLIANTLTKNGSNGANGGVVFVPTTNSSEFDPNMKAYRMLRWEE